MKLGIRLLRPEAKMPVRAHPTDSGADAFAVEAVVVPCDGTPVVVGLGLALDIPPGLEVQIRPRSGWSREGLHVCLGTVDAGFVGPVKACLYSSTGDHRIEVGDRICQLVLAPVAIPELVQVDEIGETARGANGFGSTGER